MSDEKHVAPIDGIKQGDGAIAVGQIHIHLSSDHVVSIIGEMTLIQPRDLYIAEINRQCENK